MRKSQDSQDTEFFLEQASLDMAASGAHREKGDVGGVVANPKHVFTTEKSVVGMDRRVDTCTAMVATEEMLVVGRSSELMLGFIGTA